MSFKEVVKRINKAPLELAFKQVAEDQRPLTQMLANDIELVQNLEPQTERWTEAIYRIRVELASLKVMAETMHRLHLEMPGHYGTPAFGVDLAELADMEEALAGDQTKKRMPYGNPTGKAHSESKM